MKNIEFDTIEGNIPETLRAALLERLGEIYCRNSGYREHIRREEELLRRLEESLTDNDFIYGQRRFFDYPTGGKERYTENGCQSF